MCSGCCNPFQKKMLRGGQITEGDGKSLLAYTYEGNADRGNFLIGLLPPFIIFAPIVMPINLCQITATKLTVSLSVAADGSTQVIGEVRSKSACGEEEEKLSGIRGAEMDKTLWTTTVTQGLHSSQSSKITCHLELLLAYGKKTIDCDQTGGERACREINEFIHRFAPHVMVSPSQQMMFVAVPQLQPMQIASPPHGTEESAPPSYAQPAYAQQRVPLLKDI